MGDKLIIKIDGDSKGFEKALAGVEKTGLSAFGGMEKAVKGVAIGAAAAATAVAGLATAAVKGYAEFEQLTGGIETLFKNSAPKVQEYAKNAYKTAGLTANEYLDTTMKFSARLIQGLGDDTDAAAEFANLAITDMADNVNKMGSSMEMVQDAYRGFAKGNFTMLDNLNLGYGGTREEMLRLVNESGVLERKVSNLDKVSFDQMISAIHKVQTNLGITGTTALEAEHTISGSANAAKAAWKNLVTGLADENADIEILMKNFTDSVGIMFENLLPVIKTSLRNIGTIALTSLEKMTGINFRDKFAPLFEGLGNLEKSISNGTLKMAFDNLKGWFMGSSDEGHKFGIAMNYIFGKELGEKITNFFGGIQEPMQWIVDNKDAIIGGLQGMATAFAAMAVIGGISKLLTSLLTPMGAIMAVAGLLGVAWGTNFLGMRDKLTEFVDAVKETDLKTVTNGWAAGVSENVSTWWTGVEEGFNTFKTNAVDWFTQMGTSIVDGLKEGISGGWDTIKTWFNTKVTELIDAVKGFFGIASPSTIFKDIGDDLITGLLDGITETWTTITDWAAGLFDIVTGWFDIDLFQAGKDIIDGLWKGLKDAWTAVSDWFSGIGTSIGNFFTGGGQKAEGQQDAGTMTTELANMLVVNPLEPVPQTVIDSYGLLNDAITLLNVQVALLNGYFGGATGEEGGEGGAGILAGMTAIADYAGGGFTESLDTLGTFMADTFVKNVDTTRDALFIEGGSGNTLYNALGAVQGVVESINAVLLRMIDILKYSFKEAVDKAKKYAGELVAALDPIERKGRSIAEAFDRALASILAVASAMDKVANMPVGLTSSGGKPKPWESASAWGGWSSMHGLTLVGERGPELIGTSRMMNVWRNDEIRKQMEEAGAGMSNKKYYGGQQNINANTTNDNSTNVTLGNVYGDDYLDQRMEAKLMTMIRKGVFVGAG